jgi:hypothetical protein
MYVAGVFNGFSTITPSQRAQVPSTTAITFNSKEQYQLIGSALDLEKAIHYKRYNSSNLKSTVGK